MEKFAQPYPSYSPELNPAETLLTHIERQIGYDLLIKDNY